MPENSSYTSQGKMPDHIRLVVLWIDWYPYHVARFVGLMQAPTLAGHVVGLEMVGGVGVHAGLKFREGLPADMPLETLMPQESWQSADKLKLAWMVWMKLSELNPETVLVPGYYTLPAIAAALWARLHRRKSVLMTESCSYDHTRSRWKETLKRWGLHLLFGWAVAGGADHIAYLLQLKFSRDRIMRFYDVVDNRMYSDGVKMLRKEASVDHGLPERYFLFVGRVAPEKNAIGLLAAWMIYRYKGGTWPLVIAGDGPDMPKLRAILEGSRYGKDVYLAGLKSSTQLLPFYAFASCFVLPSKREPWGLVVNEAMAAGLPVLVSSSCGCAPDLVQQGTTGWIFDPSQELQLSKHLQMVELLPDETRRRIGSNAAERIQMYSPQRFGLEVASIADARSPHSGLSQVVEQSR